IETYQEHALTRTSKSLAVSYVALQKEGEDKLIWGAGIHSDIIVASVNALVSALDNMLK
ncbi:MAG TPA: 2-isopropylmalate synthase, partial [Firmicutes bacterium]|nr:2-isopropylmalate synthase [Bacillota bacterium]